MKVGLSKTLKLLGNIIKGVLFDVYRPTPLPSLQFLNKRFSATYKEIHEKVFSPGVSQYDEVKCDMPGLHFPI